MNYKQAIEITKPSIGIAINNLDEIRGLHEFIKSQQERIKEYEQFTFDRGGDMGKLLKRLSELEEDCPDCGGHYLYCKDCEKWVDENHVSDKGSHYYCGHLVISEKCPNPSCINGKVPRTKKT